MGFKKNYFRTPVGPGATLTFTLTLHLRSPDAVLN
jgi:hypothetical protein